MDHKGSCQWSGYCEKKTVVLGRNILTFIQLAVAIMKKYYVCTNITAQENIDLHLGNDKFLSLKSGRMISNSQG